MQGDRDMVSRGNPTVPLFPPSQQIAPWAWVLDNTQVTFLAAWQQKCPAGWSFSRRQLPHSLSVFVHEGKSRWQVGSQLFTINPNDWLVIPEGVPHAANVTSYSFQATFVQFNARVFGVHCLLTLLGFPSFWEQHPFLAEPLTELVRLDTYRPIGWQLRGQAILTDLLLRCIQEEPYRFRPVLAPQDLKALRLLCPAFQLVASADRHRLSVKEMAKAVPCSLTHLRRLFHQVLGMSPRQWLLRWRLQRAAQLLQTTDATIQKIAEECGFESLSHFIRYFKAHFGVAPSYYRRQILRP